MISYLRLLAGFTSFRLNLCFVHLSAIGPSGIFESNFMTLQVLECWGVEVLKSYLRHRDCVIIILPTPYTIKHVNTYILIHFNTFRPYTLFPCFAIARQTSKWGSTQTAQER